MGQCNFLHLWHEKLYRAFRFGTLWPISCSYPRHSQLTRHSLMLANGRIRQSLTALVLICTDHCHYDLVNYLQNTQNRRQRASKLWRVLWVQRLTDVLLSLLYVIPCYGKIEHKWQTSYTDAFFEDMKLVLSVPFDDESLVLLTALWQTHTKPYNLIQWWKKTHAL